MEAYGDFAQVYDELMDETPYEEWSERVCEFIEKYGVSKPFGDSEEHLVVDLGCGTGTMTRILHKKGYDMIGIDNSLEMLSVARNFGEDILYLHQDMRELDLYSTVGTVICVCDSINYVLEEEEVKTVFSLVQNYLYPGGLFLFDFNTVYKYEEVIGDTTIAENREDCSFIWENYYDPESNINEYDVTVFVKEEDERYRCFQETHYQKGYCLEQMKKMVIESGLSVVECLDGDTWEEVTEETQRVFIVALRHVAKVER